jgi:hypothetical protein
MANLWQECGARKHTVFGLATRKQRSGEERLYAAFGKGTGSPLGSRTGDKAAIATLTKSGLADATLIQRLKKRKLALKDRIVQLERILLPDIIA